MIDFLDILLSFIQILVLISGLALFFLAIKHWIRTDFKTLSDTNEKQQAVISFLCNTYVLSFLILLASSFITSLILEYVYNKKLREKVIEIVRDDNFRINNPETKKTLDTLKINLKNIEPLSNNRNTGNYEIIFTLNSKQDCLHIRLFRSLQDSTLFWVFIENYSIANTNPIGQIKVEKKINTKQMKYINPEEVKNWTLKQIKEKYKPIQEEDFLLNEANISEFRIGLYNFFNEKERKKPIMIKEITWEKDQNTNYTIWYKKEVNQWVFIDSFIWEKNWTF